MKIYLNASQYCRRYLFALRTDNKTESWLIKHGINTIPCIKFQILPVKPTKVGGRGFVVSLKKEPKQRFLIQKRLYTTRSKSKKLSQVSEKKTKNLLSKDFVSLAKHWYICYKNQNRIFHNLKGYLKLKEIWYAAYYKLSKSKGSITSGPDYLNINDITKKKLEELRDQVLIGGYFWTGSRKVNIPKPGKPGKARPLGIPGINDRIVQEALRIIIEPIYETTFSNLSHGFRPERSCHIALKEINTRMKDSIWFIEGDIRNYFDSINHSLLVKMIEKRIKDKLIIRLIRTGLKAKVIKQNYKAFIPETGIPQGGILSPLLSNIYLNIFDKYMTKIMEEYQGLITSRNRGKNPEARKLLRKGKKSDVYKLKIPSRDPFQEGYRNVKYIRYADDFLVGILGPRSMALEIRNKIRNFLNKELAINLNLEKTKITHISNGISFLGYVFKRRSMYIRQKYGNRLLKRHMTVPVLNIDLKKVVKRLAIAGFCDLRGNPIPLFKYLRLPQYEVNKKINGILNGLASWWSIADNRKRAIAYVAYIIRYSVAKMYAAKFKMKTVARVFKTGGNDISKSLGKRAKSIIGVDEINIKKTYNEHGQEFSRTIPGILYDRYFKIPSPESNKLANNWTPNYIKLLEKYDKLDKFVKFLETEIICSNNRKNLLCTLSWRLAKGISAFDMPCVICGVTEDIQMHHIRSLMNIKKSNNPIHKHMVKLSRKQVPLCRRHHLEVHSGNWRNPTKKFFKSKFK